MSLNIIVQPILVAIKNSKFLETQFFLDSTETESCILSMDLCYECGDQCNQKPLRQINMEMGWLDSKF